MGILPVESSCYVWTQEFDCCVQTWPSTLLAKVSDEPISHVTNQTELDKIRYNVQFRKINFSCYSYMLHSAWCHSRYKLHSYFSKYPSCYPAAKNETQLPASASASS